MNDWDRIFSEQTWGRYPPEYVVRAVMTAYGHVKERKSICVLDLGCGPGACLWFLADEGFTTTGLDDSQVALGQAANILTARGVHADLVHGNFTKTLPFPNGTFDCVLDNMSVATLEALYAVGVFVEVRRVLKRGGRFISVLAGDMSSANDGKLRGATMWSPARIRATLSPAFTEITIDQYTRSMQVSDETIENLVVTARKPQ